MFAKRVQGPFKPKVHKTKCVDKILESKDLKMYRKGCRICR